MAVELGNIVDSQDIPHIGRLFVGGITLKEFSRFGISSAKDEIWEYRSQGYSSSLGVTHVFRGKKSRAIHHVPFADWDWKTGKPNEQRFN